MKNPGAVKDRQYLTTNLKTCVAGFGGAMSVLAVAPEANAVPIALTANPGSIGFQPANNIISLGTAYGLTSAFAQFNDPYGMAVFVANTGFGIAGFRSASVSDVISKSDTFFSGSFPSFLSPITASGTFTFGFRTPSAHLGWLRIDFSGLGGTVTYLGAAIESDPNVSIHVPAAAVPESGPGVAALAGLWGLALGAVGVRRNRRAKAKSTQ